MNPPTEAVACRLTRLLEFSQGQRQAHEVDAARGIIRGVKVLGLASRNGRVYLASALARARTLYEGAKVHVNHARDADRAPRDYQDRIGTLKSVRLLEDGLYADLHYNPKHALAEQLAWDAQQAPENVGLSHHVQARTRQVDGRQVVDEIVAVISVDLVADPATTCGLFEAEENPMPDSLDEREVRERRTGLAAEAAALPASAAVVEAETPARPQPTAVECREREITEQESARTPCSLHEELARLRAQLEQYQAREAGQARREEVEELLAESGLPSEVASELFFEQLLEATHAQRQRLIEDRRQLWQRARFRAPRSQDQQAIEPLAPAGAALVHDAASFVAAIRR